MSVLKIEEQVDVIDQSWSVIDVARKCPPASWEQLFLEMDSELVNISATLDRIRSEHVNSEGYSFYPLMADLFAAYNYTQLNNVKVVIVGQDPYPQSIYVDGNIVPRATGLAFSVRREDDIPGSLLNIFKELEARVDGFTRPTHGDLTHWTRQGVMLLNMSLTYPTNHNKTSDHQHYHMWRPLIYKTIEMIKQHNPNCVFVLWGKKAQTLKAAIGDKMKVLEAAHPSGYSAYKGFFNCNHFNIINEHLRTYAMTQIIWDPCIYEQSQRPINIDTISSMINNLKCVDYESTNQEQPSTHNTQSPKTHERIKLIRLP